MSLAQHLVFQVALAALSFAWPIPAAVVAAGYALYLIVAFIGAADGLIRSLNDLGRG